MVCTSVRAIIHSLTLVDYLPVQTHKPYSNYRLFYSFTLFYQLYVFYHFGRILILASIPSCHYLVLLFVLKCSDTALILRALPDLSYKLLSKIDLFYPKFLKSPLSAWNIFYSIYEPPHDKTNKMICAPSEDSDQPGHPPRLIRVFAVRSMDS